MNRFSHVAFLLAAGCLLSAGCGRTPPASYRLNMVEATKQRLTTEQERQVATVLLAMFGTPDEPVALPETGLDEAKLRLASGPVRSDIVGRKNGLYREHCAHCHGVTGDGMGPTAAFLKPYPRDYRPGIFKFKSTERADKPTHADLLRILRNGIAGTSMPSFALLSEPQIDALVEYVKYLSIRGETSTSGMSAEDAAEHRKQVAWLGRFSHVVDGDALVPRTIPPRNLRLGVYRGGRRPLDLYYRIHAGINGAPMPAAKGTVPPEDIWHIVNYIRSLPYEFDGELGADRPMVARDRF